MTAESLLSHLTEFGGTDLKHCPALAVKLFNELNNKVEFIYEHGQVTCEEMKLTYLKKMVDHTKFAVVHCNDGLQHTSAAIISIYHSIDIWEEFSTTGVFSTENRSAYRRRWENYR